MGGLLVLLPVVLAVLASTIVAIVLISTARPDGSLVSTVAAARRHSVGFGVLAVLAGLAAAVLSVNGPLRANLGIVLAPTIAALAHTAVLAVGELTWPRPKGAVRRAALLPRTADDVAPRRLRLLLRAATGLTVAVAGAGWLLAAEDGRSISRVAEEAGGSLLGNAASPFPGPVYGVPAVVGVVLVLAVAEAVLRLIATRPAVVDADPPSERALRRASAHRVLRGALSATLFTVGGLLFFGGTSAARIDLPGVLHAGAVLSAIAGVGCVLAALAVLCVPAPRLPADPSRPTPSTADAARR